ARVRLQRAVLYQLDRTRRRGGDRNDLVGFAVHGEDRHADLLEVVGPVLADEPGDGVVLALRAAHHALAPPVRDDRLGRLDARLVVVVERPRPDRPVELPAFPPRLPFPPFHTAP